jgi:glutamate dehydrogenase (NAD(P)+)
MSKAELERMSRRYFSQIGHIIGPNRDIPAPDMNTNAQIMSWFMDEYGRAHGHTTQIVTGKPVALGGSLGREAATGRGCVDVMNEACRDAGLGPPEELTVVIQGFGNVGSWAARIAAEQGYKVIAVSDVKGGIVDERGLDIPALLKYVDESGTVVDFPGSETITNDQLLGLTCDVLMPAALGEVITHRNVEQIDTKIVIEAANHPVTPVADAALFERGVVVVPDILANAGGVTVSYFEWVQNNQEIAWDEDDVNSRLAARLRTAYSHCREFQGGNGGISLREAAFALAVNRVVEAATLRGYL